MAETRQIPSTTAINISGDDINIKTSYLEDNVLPDTLSSKIAGTDGELATGSQEGVNFQEGELLIEMKNYPSRINYYLNDDGTITVFSGAGDVDFYSINDNGELIYSDEDPNPIETDISFSQYKAVGDIIRISDSKIVILPVSQSNENNSFAYDPTYQLTEDGFETFIERELTSPFESKGGSRTTNILPAITDTVWMIPARKYSTNGDLSNIAALRVNQNAVGNGASVDYNSEPLFADFLAIARDINYDTVGKRRFSASLLSPVGSISIIELGNSGQALLKFTVSNYSSSTNGIPLLDIVSGDGYLLIRNKGLYKTTTEGFSWTQISNGVIPTTDPQENNSLNNFVFTGGSDIFVGNERELFRTNNEGSSYELIKTRFLTSSFFKSAFYLKNKLLLFEHTPNAGILEVHISDDLGDSFTTIQVEGTYDNILIRKLAYISEDKFAICGVTRNATEPSNFKIIDLSSIIQ